MINNTLSSSWSLRIPKVELHLHLEGSLRPSLLRKLAAKNGYTLPPPAADGNEPAYSYANFLEFLDCFKTACMVLKSPEDLAAIAASLFDELIEQHVLYAEIFLSPVIHERQGIPAEETMRLIDAIAREKQRYYGFRCRFLFDAVRQWGVESAALSLHLAELCHRWGVIGIGLGGDEASLSAQAFAPIYARARAAGLHTTVHAGEACGVPSILETLKWLQPERIGHGIRAVEDHRLLQRLADSGIALDLCLTSNIRTGVWPDLDTHPIRDIYAAGVPLSLNTDDPALFFTTLSEEYHHGMRLLHLNETQAEPLVMGAVQASFLDSRDKSSLANSVKQSFLQLG